jgi:predicted phage tail protein
MAKKRSNTSVPSKWELPERRFGETIKENLDILIGHRGSPLERAVTFQDLLDTNVLSLARNVSGSTIGDDPRNDFVPTPDVGSEVQPPPAPTNLDASGAFQNIILTWDMSGYVGHSHFEIHRHTSDSISDATLIAQVSGFTKIYSDAAGSNQTLYYWVRAVNILDEIGPFNSSTGTQGVTQPDVGLILDLLEEQITSSELALKSGDSDWANRHN